MKIAIIGASRGIGAELLKAAIEDSHEVTALVRDPAKLNANIPGLKVIKGDILDPSSVAAAIAGQEAICICIGIPPTRKPVDVFSRGTQNILGAIETGSNQKLILVTGIGAGDSKGHGGFFYDRILNPLLLANNYADKDRAESLVKASNIDWLIVRPGFLTDGPQTGKYRVIDNLSGVTAGKISRADVADFILKQLASPTHFGKTPLLMY
ncbi:NAD(P)-dependent oxidoreductase [Chamaesiphon minutus]|uniref:Putative NADH-flavin reductase n=1 Tax=Chamaesiphon minutus (strain ATCC 27169 / PCC 6605) TaxID=1173020 RepID=K9UBL0_CHAP6|nr:SDR family oxidoreductase [Chamaesiphon minutus]AFY92220.1 putative NADH-flavin reductase [Chamaesiphon minutus PCC 6605]